MKATNITMAFAFLFLVNVAVSVSEFVICFRDYNVYGIVQGFIKCHSVSIV